MLASGKKMMELVGDNDDGDDTDDDWDDGSDCNGGENEFPFLKGERGQDQIREPLLHQLGFHEPCFHQRAKADQVKGMVVFVQCYC